MNNIILECPICLLPLNTGTTLSGCCNTRFHTVCYTKCMILKLECPMCRGKHSGPGEVVLTINPVHEVITVPESGSASKYLIICKLFVRGSSYLLLIILFAGLLVKLV